MAIYRNIQMSFWTDSKIMDDFTPEDKYFYLYLLTNPHTNLAGCYEISLKQLTGETGYTEDRIMKLIDRLENIHGNIRYSRETKEILVLNWSKYNWTNSEKFKKSLTNDLSKIKDERFKQYLVNIISGKDPGLIRPDTVSLKTDTVSEKKDTVSKAFIPPTLEEVSAYCRERNNGIDAQTFIDFYGSKGWMVGKNKMKDWKACIRTWEQRGREEPGKAPTYTQQVVNRMQVVKDWANKEDDAV